MKKTLGSTPGRGSTRGVRLLATNDNAEWAHTVYGRQEQRFRCAATARASSAHLPGGAARREFRAGGRLERYRHCCAWFRPALRACMRGSVCSPAALFSCLRVHLSVCL